MKLVYYYNISVLKVKERVWQTKLVIIYAS